MRLPTGGAVSGWAALRLWGGGFFDGTSDGHVQLPVDLVVPPGSDLRAAPGIAHHRQAVSVEEITLRHGITCAVPTRALFDAIRWEPSALRRQQIADLALSARLVSRDAARSYVNARKGARGRKIAAGVIDRASDRVLSPQETTLRLLWERDVRLPPLRCNWPVLDLDGRRLGRPDLLCEAEAVVIEYDGRDHTRDDVRWVDMGKEDAYRRCGLEYMRVINRDLRHPARIRARMHQAVARSRASSIPRRYQLATNPTPVLGEWDARTDLSAEILS